MKKTVEKKHKSEKKHNSPITARIHTRHWQSQCRAEKSHPTITKTSQGRNPRPKPEETHKTNYPRPKPLIRGLKIHTKKSTKNVENVVSKEPYRHATGKRCVSQVWRQKMGHERP